MKNHPLLAVVVALGLATPLAAAPMASADAINDHSLLSHQFAAPMGGVCSTPLKWATTGDPSGMIIESTSPDGSASASCADAHSSGAAVDSAISSVKQKGWSVSTKERTDSYATLSATKGDQTRLVKIAEASDHAVTSTWQWTTATPGDAAQLADLAHVSAQIDAPVPVWSPKPSDQGVLDPHGTYNAYNVRFNYFCEIPNGWAAVGDYNGRTLGAVRDADTRMLCSGMWGPDDSADAAFNHQVEVLRQDGWSVSSDKRTDTVQTLVATKDGQTSVRVNKRYSDRVLSSQWFFRTTEKDSFMGFLSAGYLIGASDHKGSGTSRGVEARTGVDDAPSSLATLLVTPPARAAR